MSEGKVFAPCNFKSHQADYVAPKLEEKLRSELEATLAVPYQLEGDSAAHTTVGSVVKDAINLLVSKSSSSIFTLHFSPTQPRPFQLSVRITRGGVGSFVGGLLYSIRLSRPVSGEILLEQPKTFGQSKFTGEVQVCGKLNGQPELIKLANKFSRTRIGYNGIIVNIPRLFKIVSDEPGGAWLIINTLPKQGLSNCLLGAKDFLELAQQLEATI